MVDLTFRLGRRGIGVIRSSMVRLFEQENFKDLAHNIFTLSADRDLCHRLTKNSARYAEANRSEAKQYEYIKLVESLVGNDQVTENRERS